MSNIGVYSSVSQWGFNNSVIFRSSFFMIRFWYSRHYFRFFLQLDCAILCNSLWLFSWFYLLGISKPLSQHTILIYEWRVPSFPEQKHLNREEVSLSLTRKSYKCPVSKTVQNVQLYNELRKLHWNSRCIYVNKLVCAAWELQDRAFRNHKKKKGVLSKLRRKKTNKYNWYLHSPIHHYMISLLSKITVD